MHLIRHHALRTALSVNLICLKPTVKRTLGLTAQCQEELIDAMMRAISGCVIVSPDMVGQNTGSRPGRFGVDEPHPFPHLVDEHGVPRVPGSR
jgi:hypothetical protein